MTSTCMFFFLQTLSPFSWQVITAILYNYFIKKIPLGSVQSMLWVEDFQVISRRYLPFSFLKISFVLPLSSQVHGATAFDPQVLRFELLQQEWLSWPLAVLNTMQKVQRYMTLLKRILPCKECGFIVIFAWECNLSVDSLILLCQGQ